MGDVVVAVVDIVRLMMNRLIEPAVGDRESVVISPVVIQ